MSNVHFVGPWDQRKSFISKKEAENGWVWQKCVMCKQQVSWRNYHICLGSYGANILRLFHWWRKREWRNKHRFDPSLFSTEGALYNRSTQRFPFQPNPNLFFYPLWYSCEAFLSLYMRDSVQRSKEFHFGTRRDGIFQNPGILEFFGTGLA